MATKIQLLVDNQKQLACALSNNYWIGLSIKYSVKISF